MLPIGPMMAEHRLIERMIHIIKDELKIIQDKKEINPIFIDNAIDFIRTYADQTHHGKEEDILFRDLGKKKMSNELKKIMNELIEEHKFGRKTTKETLTICHRNSRGSSRAAERQSGRAKSAFNL